MAQPAGTKPELTALYDADCGICDRSVRWIRRLDWRDRVECVPLQDIDPAEVVPSVDPPALLERMHVVDRDGEVTDGWDGVVSLARRFPLTRWLTPLDRIGIVHRIGHRAYDRVAANRDRHCTIPSR